MLGHLLDLMGELTPGAPPPSHLFEERRKEIERSVEEWTHSRKRATDTRDTDIAQESPHDSIRSAVAPGAAALAEKRMRRAGRESAHAQSASKIDSRFVLQRVRSKGSTDKGYMHSGPASL